MSDIVERLNRGEGCLLEGGQKCISMNAVYGCLCAIAADEITRLTADNERLRAANTIILEAAKELVQNQCEGFCTDWPLGAYDPEMDIDCSVCKLRAALSGVK